MSCICGKRACTCGSGNYETFDKTVPATQVTNIIPIGKGDTGDSAYEVAVSNGFVGTEAQWLASLIGPPGADGLTILSTVDNGDGTFTINYSDGSSFTSGDLTGPQGLQGLPGLNGTDGIDGEDGVGVANTVDNGDGTFTINYTDGSFYTSPDLTGPQGDQGAQGLPGQDGVDGIDGADGNNGWTAVTAIVSRNDDEVEQIIDWVGGEGTKPPVNQYIGETGWVTDINLAKNIRGAQGQSGAGSGDMLQVVYDPNGSQTDVYDRANHTGTQAISTVINLQPALEARELLINKATDFTVINNILYPTVQATDNHITSRLTDYIPLSQKGVNNGVAPLDASGKIPSEYVDITGVRYLGEWDASTNTPAIANGTGNAGDYYRVTTPGTQDLGGGSITFTLGDDVMYNGTVWQRVPSSQSVQSVNGQTGMVTLGKADVGLGNVDNTSDVNKPISSATASALGLKANIVDLSDVATSGDYNDLINKPTIGIGTVTSVNGATPNGAGAVTINTDDLTEGINNLYFTQARARASLTGAGDINYNPTTGVISATIPAAQTLSQPSIGQIAISSGNTVALNTVNMSGNQTGIAGDKTWTGSHTFSALSGTGNRMVIASNDGTLSTQAIPTANDGTLSLATGTGLTGSASFSANQSTPSTFTVEAASGYAIPTTAKQTEWDTAFGWGDHASAGYAVTGTGVSQVRNNQQLDGRYYQSQSVNLPALGGTSRVFPWTGSGSPIAGDVAGIFDFDDIVTPGFHHVFFNGGGTSDKAPKTGYWWVEVHRHSPNSSTTNLVQIAHPYRIQDGKWMRTRYNGVWSGWIEFYTSYNLTKGTSSGNIVEVQGDGKIDPKLIAYTVPAVLTSNKTLSASDKNAYIRVTGTVTITMPAGLSETDYPIGSTTNVRVSTGATVSFAGASGVTLDHPDGAGNVSVEGRKVVSIVRVDTNAYDLIY